MYGLKHTAVGGGCACVLLGALLLTQRADAAVVNANWTGGGDGSSYSDGLNWDIGVVPIDNLADTYVVNIPANQAVTFNVPTAANTVFQLTLGSSATLTINPGRDLAVTDAADIAGLVSTSNGAFTANSVASQFSGNASRILASGGAGVIVNAASYTNTANSGDLIAADDPGTVINLAGVLSINNDKDFGGSPITTIAARNGGVVNLSGLTSVVGARGGDSLRFEVSGGGSLDLSSLTAISGSRNVRFTSDGTALSLPSLQTITGGVLFELASGTAFNLPSLTSIDGAGSGITTVLAPPTSGSLTAAALTSLRRTTLTLEAGQTLTTGALGDIDGSRLLISGGQVFNSVSAATYDSTDFFGSGDFFTATDAGTVLNLSTLTSLNFDQDFGGSPIYTIAARDGGTVDLSGLTNVVGARGGDSLQFSVTNGGSIDLTNLTSITGSRNVRFTSDGTAFALPNLSTITSAVVFELGANQALSLPALTSYDGTGSNFSATFNAPAGGSITANSLLQMDDVDISAGVGGTVNLPALASFTRGTLTLGAGQTLNVGTINDIDGSRFLVSGGQTVNGVTATSYDSLDFIGGGDFFSATGAGTNLNLSTLTSLNFDQDFGGSPIYTVAARDGGTVDLSGVTNVVGARGGDTLRFEVGTGGTILLNNLQSITGSRNVRFTSDGTGIDLPNLTTINGAVVFELGATQVLSLPALTNYDGTGSNFSATFIAPAGGSISANALLQMDDVDISAGVGGTVNLPALASFTRGTLTLGAGQALNVGTLNDIDGSRFLISGGQIFTGVAASTYSSLSHFGGGDFFSATGAGTNLNLSTLTSLNFDQDFGGSPIYTVAARDGGTVDLSGVTNVVGARGGDTLRFEVGTGGTILLNNLQSITGSRNVRFTSDGTGINLPNLQTIDAGVLFELSPGQTLDLLALTNINGAGSGITTTLAATDGGAINAPLLTSVTRTTVSQAASQTLNLGTLSDIDGSRFQISGGQTFNAVAATSYDSLDYFGGGDVFSATGAGTSLNLSTITTIDFNQNFGGSPVYTVAARSGGAVDLSGLVSVTGATGGDFLEFLAQTNGTIDLTALTTETQNTRFTANTGGVINFGSLTNIDANLSATDLNSALDVAGSLKLGPNSTLAVSNGAELRVGGDYSFEQTVESDVNLDAGVLRMDGAGGQLLEVGGEDLGVNGSTSGNFGIGQLVIGQTAQRTSVDLIDAIDNGNRGVAGTESLYLYGLGGPDGLRILNNSALILNGINVYAFDALTTQMVQLNSLFGPGDLRIPFDDGFLQLVPLDFQWSNNLGGDFNVGPNWSDNFVPLGSDTGIWNLGSVAGYTVQFGTNVATDSAIIKTDIVTYDLGGFTYTNAALNATTAVVVGQDPTDNASLTVTNGTLAGPSARVASTAGSTGLLTVSNGGVLNIGTLSFGLGTGTVDVATGGTAIIQTLDAGTVGKFNVTDGVALVGTGSTAGLPAGSYTQTDGTLAVAFASVPVAPDPAVTAVGVADLGGTLSLSLDAGFVLSAGDSFQILAAASIVGSFDTVLLPVDPALSLGVQYGIDNVTVVAGLIGDLNLDGFVGIADLNLVLGNWNQNVAADVWLLGDPTGDGFVGIGDLNVVLGNWNAGTPPPAEALALVPEPGTLGLLLIGAGALAGRTRR
jgi:PEP-CTERM motif